MDEKSLYAHILNLSAPWQVSSLSLGKNSGSMTVTVGIAEQTPLICPTYVKTCPIHDTYAVNGVTSIPSSSLHWLKLMFRIDCPENDCQTLLVPRSGPGTRYTLQFEFFVLSWLKISTVDAVRKQLVAYEKIPNIVIFYDRSWSTLCSGASARL